MPDQRMCFDSPLWWTAFAYSSVSFSVTLLTSLPLWNTARHFMNFVPKNSHAILCVATNDDDIILGMLLEVILFFCVCSTEPHKSLRKMTWQMCVTNKETPGLKLHLHIASCGHDAEYSRDKAGLIEMNGYNVPPGQLPPDRKPPV